MRQFCLWDLMVMGLYIYIGRVIEGIRFKIFMLYGKFKMLGAGWRVRYICRYARYYEFL